MDKDNNMIIYNAVKDVPESAKKPITGGRLKGMTDISPMWRIKMLTELFGPCGIGWRYEITSQDTVGGSGGEVAAFVGINLFYKMNGEWSEPIPGIGGSMLVASESKGLRTDDEAFKKALTDAISVSAKALGVGATVYWPNHDQSKYDTRVKEPKVPESNPINTLIAETAKVFGRKSSEISGLVLSKFGTDGKLPTGKIKEAEKYLLDLKAQHELLAGQRPA